MKDLRPFVVAGLILAVGVPTSIAIENALTKNIDPYTKNKKDRIIRKSVSMICGFVAADASIGIVDAIVYKIQR